MRDKIGSFNFPQRNVETFLNNWIVNYVTEDDSASHEVKAPIPDARGRIEVIENKAKPGVFRPSLFWRPHFQLEELSVSLRLVAELRSPFDSRPLAG